MSKIAVLISGGMDSCILVNKLVASVDEIYPIYVRQGLVWERTEEHFLKKYLDKIVASNIQSLKVIEQIASDIYESHWSVTGKNVPDQNTDDGAVYLPGRNLLLLTKAGVWCALNGINTIALGTLKGNPFSDNSNEFYNSIAKSINIATGSEINIIRPFADKNKAEILDEAEKLPLHLTFSCIQPQDNKHCGKCNKCAERKMAYQAIKIEDLTEYCN